MRIDNGEVDPFMDETPKPTTETVEDIRVELEQLERKKAYLLELLEFYGA